MPPSIASAAQQISGVRDLLLSQHLRRMRVTVRRQVDVACSCRRRYSAGAVHYALPAHQRPCLISCGLMQYACLCAIRSADKASLIAGIVKRHDCRSLPRLRAQLALTWHLRMPSCSRRLASTGPSIPSPAGKLIAREEKFRALLRSRAGLHRLKAEGTAEDVCAGNRKIAVKAADI